MLALFHSGKNVYVEVYSNFSSTNRATVSLKEAIINYQLKDDIDLTSCNGVVNTEAGCVLFNTRTQVGASGLKSNIFNASLTTIKGAPVACDSAKDNLCIQNANSVIKVSPDRICSRWLDCQTFTEDPITKEKYRIVGNMNYHPNREEKLKRILK